MILPTLFGFLLYSSDDANVRQLVLPQVLLQSTQRCKNLVHSGCGFEVNFLPLTADDPGSYLRQRLALLIFAVRVIKLFQTNRTVRRMRALIAGPQTLVSGMIAVAVAGQLINNLGYFGRKFVGMCLIRVRERRSPKLVF